jgi:hypothetical protein
VILRSHSICCTTNDGNRLDLNCAQFNSATSLHTVMAAPSGNFLTRLPPQPGAGVDAEIL